MATVIEQGPSPGYVFKTIDAGREGWSALSPIEKALRDLINGLEYGYPLCCIEEYCLDSLEGRYSAWRRGTVPWGFGKYVPCSKCCAEMGRGIIP